MGKGRKKLLRRPRSDTATGPGAQDFKYLSRPGIPLLHAMGLAFDDIEKIRDPGAQERATAIAIKQFTERAGALMESNNPGLVEQGVKAFSRLIEAEAAVRVARTNGMVKAFETATMKEIAAMQLARADRGLAVPSGPVGPETYGPLAE